jgi:hypothetical protein
MIKRLRPKYTDQQLKQIYAKPHDSKQWLDHWIRVAQTREMVKWVCEFDYIKKAADLSCGNANIANATDPSINWYLGDYAPGYEFTGPIEETIHQISNIDLFVLSETLEHLDDPGKVLWEIRQKTRYIVLSTPDNAGDDPNPEHYWSWDTDDIKSMLIDVGFEPFVLNKLQLVDYLYDYQIWGAR